MNDSTSRRYKGTLLERAAEHYHFGVPVAPAVEVRERSAPVPAPAPAAPPAPAPQPAFEKAQAPEGPTIRRGSEVRDVPDHPAPRSAAPGRRRVAIDRERLSELGMIVPGSAVTPLAEEFRLVKRQLLLTARAVAGADADRARMVLVCSARQNEGKTFCAINLALSMAAEKDFEILLVDADFAKPDILKRLGADEGPGLLDALSGSISDVEECILDTDIPQLSILPAGTKSANDTELLASDRARAVLDALAAANSRRIVIFDSPPVLAASPASVLALHVGQVMLVVRADQTNEGDLREAVAMVDACEHIQLVLNGVSFQPSGYRFGSYYGEAAK
ncbi:AAA family ATPase [Sphingosinithalassobacter sp. CS137]|uniref:AAA family ATPase n=1 Tax=Sphingosinithalassobacter sp. CS137 TaxID=2762748 RepID=UPI00165E782C|nr:AAA family ATPase [Sphingosinithalassobacter sp. CS137]